MSESRRSAPSSPQGTPTALADPPGQAQQVLFGRDETITRLVSAVTAPASAPLILLTGPLGIGRSSVLAAVGDALARQSVSTLGFRVSRSERDRSYAVASRLSAELGALHRDVDSRTTRTGPLAEPRLGGAGRLASALGAAMTTRRRLVVLVDDVQWIDPGSREALIPLIRTLAGMPVTLVGTLRWPLSESESESESSALRELQEAGLAKVIGLRPLPQSAVTALVTHELQARPSAELSARLRRNCRGLPAAVLAAISGYRRSGALSVVDRHAYLVIPDRPPELARDLRLFEHLKQLGEQVWSVAKALSVLYPLGAAAVGLIATATTLSEDEVRTALATLRAEGVIRRGQGQEYWRFAPPLAGIALSGRLGQYERRRLSQLAATAIWAGEIRTDNRHLAEHLVTAGRFVDAKRAGDALLAMGAAAMLDEGYLAERWLRTAIELVTEPARRAQALLLHASTCCLHQRFAESAGSAGTLLSGHADLVPSEAVLELEMIYLVSVSGMGDTEALERIVDDGWRSFPGGDGHRIVTRASALCLLDRWREATELLESTWDTWRGDNDNVAAMGLIYFHTASAYLGRMGEFDRVVDRPTEWPMWSERRHRFALLAGLPRLLMSLGELGRAQRMLTNYDLPLDSTPLADHMVEDSLSGHWDRALDRARTAMANGSALGYVPAHTVMCREAAIILSARGQLAQARSVIERAHTDQPILQHLVAGAESELERTLGATARARTIITEALVTAEKQGVVMGTDELWPRLAEWALEDQDPAEADRAVAGAAETAALLGTGRSRLGTLVTTAVVRQDDGAATEAVGVARERAQPYELAYTIVTLARWGLAGDAALLTEAYELFGELDALLPRTRLRNLMRDRDIAVPGRSATVAENERLLAVLVTEGLTNRELAVVLDASEKSVEGRLSRLFKRTGYRSRVELASAMLTGEYPS